MNQHIKRLSELGISPFDIGFPFYKYRSIEGAVKILKSNELYFPNANQLDDKFELHHSFLDLNSTPDLQDRYIERIFKQSPDEAYSISNDDFYKMQLSTIENFKNTIGIFSSATSPDNNFLWQEYGGNHKGVCLGFKFPENMVPVFFTLGLPFFVNYTDTPLQIKYIDERNAEMTQDFAYWLCTKQKLYDREAEIRILDVNYCGPKIFPKEILHEIIFGCETMQGDQDEILRIVEDYSYPIKRRGYCNKADFRK
jgi:hypothetical protein